ncbi:winged helix-turn-helix domain-containing protein [Natrarchaeobius sp. A-rgal3]|uniref:winged helix-turn-helix domain-containing protein n=1 Tax=Natrarchaeobius versutus TaxID=1679078 RepID=UPI003510C1DD
MSDQRPRSYTDNSAFVRLLETEGRVRVLDVLLRRPGVELTAADISKLAGIDESTFSRNKDVLESFDIVETEYRDGHAVYTLNTESEIVEVLAGSHGTGPVRAGSRRQRNRRRRRRKVTVDDRNVGQ